MKSKTRIKSKWHIFEILKEILADVSSFAKEATTV